MSSADRSKAAMEAFLKNLKLSQLQALCGKGSIKQDGDKSQLAARIAAAAKITGVDFDAVDLENLSYMQLLGKCVSEGLPTQGRRSQLISYIRSQGDKKRKTPDDSASPNYNFLVRNRLNVGGTKAQRIARRKLFAEGKYDQDFAEMEVHELTRMADLLSLTTKGNEPRKELLARVIGAHEARAGGTSPDKDDRGKDGERKKRKKGSTPSRPCINVTCSKLAEDGLCPKTGGPLLACSINCYRSWKLQQDDPAAALHQLKLSEAIRENERLAKEIEKLKISSTLDLTKSLGDGAAGDHGNGGAELTNQEVLTKALLAVCNKLEKIDDTIEKGTDKPDDGKSTAADPQGTALIDKLSKISPHKVKLVWKGDAESFGLHVARALDYCKVTDSDGGAVSLLFQTKERKKAILQLFHSNPPEALRQANALVIMILGWAGDFEIRNRGIEEAKISRAEQVQDYNTALHEMQDQLIQHADGLAQGSTFVQRQIQLFANAALGATIARAAIKSMIKADEWRTGLEKKYGSGSSDTLGSADAIIQKLTDALAARVGGGGGNRGGGSGGQGNNGGVAHAGAHAPRPNGGAGGSGKTPPPADAGGNAKVLGLILPTSQAIVGSNVAGASVKNGSCAGCNGVGHEPTECPTLFGRTFAGRSMPGWHNDGSKNIAMWDGTAITAACLKQWQAMQGMGFFIKTPRGPAQPLRFV
jgi:hypothetical protein